MKNFFKRLIFFVRNLFSKKVEDNKHYETEHKIAPEKIHKTSNIFLDQEIPIYLSLKRATNELNIRNLTGLIDFFNSCYNNRLCSDWCEKVINSQNEKEVIKMDTVGVIRNRILYKALRAFFGCFGIYASLGPGYDYGSSELEIKEDKDWDMIMDWTLSKMTHKWSGFIECPTQSDAVRLIFTFDKNGDF